MMMKQRVPTRVRLDCPLTYMTGATPAKMFRTRAPSSRILESDDLQSIYFQGHDVSSSFFPLFSFRMLLLKPSSPHTR